MFEFIIPGKAQPKQRPRISRKTNTVYTPYETLKYEKLVGLSFLQNKGKRIDDGAVSIKIVYCMQPPKSCTKKVRSEILAGNIQPTKAPDLDNIAKSILDGLNKIAFKDDCQVVELIVQKRYLFHETAPFVIVYLQELHNVSELSHNTNKE